MLLGKFKVEEYDWDLMICDGCKIKFSEIRRAVNELADQYPENDVIKNRSLKSIKGEIFVHKILHQLGLVRSEVMDIDVDYPIIEETLMGRQISGEMQDKIYSIIGLFI